MFIKLIYTATIVILSQIRSKNILKDLYHNLAIPWMLLLKIFFRSQSKINIKKSIILNSVNLSKHYINDEVNFMNVISGVNGALYCSLVVKFYSYVALARCYTFVSVVKRKKLWKHWIETRKKGPAFFYFYFYFFKWK